MTKKSRKIRIEGPHDAAKNCRILTVEEFAEHFRIGRTKVYQLIKDGKLVAGVHFFRLGDKVLFPLVATDHPTPQACSADAPPPPSIK